MKTQPTFNPRQHGFIVIALITILGMMSLYVATNLRTLAILKRDIQLIEKKQVQHWSKTNKGQTANLR